MKLFLLLFILSFPLYAQDCQKLKNEVENFFNNQTEGFPKILKTKNPPKAIVMIAHGLNNTPNAMTPLADFFLKENYEVVQMIFKKDWQKEAYLQYCKAQFLSEQKKLPLYFLGFSLGGLIFEEMLNQKDDLHFSKAILLAPSIALHSYAYLINFLTLIAPQKLIIPSSAPEKYRANKRGTSLALYKSLFDSLKNLEKTEFKKSHLPTLVVIDPKDELVSFEKTKKMIDRYQLSSWEVFLIEKRNEEGKTYHHQIFHPDSFSTSEWKNLTEKMISFLK